MGFPKVLNIALYQDGTVFLMTPFAEDVIPNDFLQWVDGLPNADSVVHCYTEGIHRWRMPVGYCYLPVLLNALLGKGYSIQSTVGIPAVERGDVVMMYTMLK
eukprot:Rmarinus@m.24355